MIRAVAFHEAAVVELNELLRFPYTVIYSLRDEQIRVLALAHEKRRPFYWRGRR